MTFAKSSLFIILWIYTPCLGLFTFYFCKGKQFI
nr:MAG TPA: hypothetical protein [Caudoviricetes sp.]